MANQFTPAVDDSQDFYTLVVGHSSEQPLMKAGLASNQVIPDTAERVDAAGLGIDRLAPLLQAVPSLAVAGEVATTQLMEVVINGPLCAASNGDGFRAFTREAGRIKENARLFKPEKLQQLVNSAAMFQIASAVVAQKHLADISAKLSEIIAGVSAIAEFLDRERSAKIKAALNYLKQIAPVVLAGEATSGLRPELESIERDLEAIQHHLSQELAALAKEASEYKDPGVFETTATLTSELKKTQSKADGKAQEWRLCMSIRLVACRLLGSFPNEAALASQRQQILNDAAQAFFGPTGPLTVFNETVVRRAKALSSYRDSQSVIQANRLALREWEDETFQPFMLSARKNIGQIQHLLVEQQTPVRLLVEMRGGECVGAYRG